MRNERKAAKSFRIRTNSSTALVLFIFDSDFLDNIAWFKITSRKNGDEGLPPKSSFKKIKPQTSSRKKTKKQNLPSYTEACNAAQSYDWSTEFLFESLLVVEA